MASEYQQAHQKLEVALKEFQATCGTDRMFEAGVRELVDTLQPYVLTSAQFSGGPGSTQLKSSSDR